MKDYSKGVRNAYDELAESERYPLANIGIDPNYAVADFEKSLPELVLDNTELTFQEVQSDIEALSMYHQEEAIAMIAAYIANPAVTKDRARQLQDRARQAYFAAVAAREARHGTTEQEGELLLAKRIRATREAYLVALVEAHGYGEVNNTLFDIIACVRDGEGFTEVSADIEFEAISDALDNIMEGGE